MIQNCNFQVFRAKCLNLKANNCLVENCSFSGSYQPAVSAAPEWYFEEGPTVRHLVVRNNTFQCAITATSKSDRTIRRSPAPSRDTVDVLIEGNHFENYGAHASVFAKYYPVGNAMRVQNAKDVTIRNNDFGRPAPTAPPGVPKLIVKNSDHVVIENNINLSTAEIEQDNVSPLTAPSPAITDSQTKSARPYPGGIVVFHVFRFIAGGEATKSPAKGPWLVTVFSISLISSIG